MNSSLIRIVFVAMLALSVRSYAADGSSFKPPAGAKVAIVVFEDLECPDCAANYPIVFEKAKLHQIPVMLYDFPLTIHKWSFDAAVWARFFDTKSQKIGNDFRGFIYSNQRQITRANLQQWVQKFGDNNKIPLPFIKDPEGKLAEKVKADYELGQRIGIAHTPTVFLVSKDSVIAPFVEIMNRDQLSQNIEDMLKKVNSATPPKQTSTKAKKKAS